MFQGMNNFNIKETILIVDDDPENLKLLSLCFKDKGYRILSAQDGESAIQKIKLLKPAIILLDVMMPGIDGFETCKRIKEFDATKDIPVIFMTALNDTESILKGYEVGAIDYISKPFNFDEIKVRVANYLKFQKQANTISKNAQDLKASNDELVVLNMELKAGNIELIKEIEERKKAENALANSNISLQKTVDKLERMQDYLTQTEVLTSLSDLATGFTDEVKSHIDITITSSSHLKDVVKEGNANSNEIIDETNTIYENLISINKLINNFKLVSKDRAESKKRTFGVYEYINEVLISIRSYTKDYKHNIIINCEESLKMTSYPGALSQVLENLIRNSFIHGFDSSSSGVIKIDIHQDNEETVIRYHDNGTGITNDIISNLYEPFQSSKLHDGNLGLGMYIVHELITKQLSGSIQCTSRLGEGVFFKIIVPSVL